MLQHLIRPAGNAAPLISLETFIRRLRNFTRGSLVAGFNDFSWKAWRGEFTTSHDNNLSLSVAPHLALLSFAYGAMNSSNAPCATIGDVIDLQLAYLTIDASRKEMHDADSAAVAKAAITDRNISELIPNLDAAEKAISGFSICRMIRLQMIPSEGGFDELSRIWWIARRLDRESDQLRTAQRILGMEIPVFIRGALALLSLAVTSEHNGCVSLGGGVDADFTRKYDVDANTLLLAADKLSTSREDFLAWLSEAEGAVRPGMAPFIPMALMSTPLLKFEEPDSPQFVCPSFSHFVSAMRDRLRDAISTQGGMPTHAIRIYGTILAKYVEEMASAANITVLNLDTVEPSNEKHADLLLVEGEYALLVEVKRSIAPGLMSRYLIDPRGIVEMLSHLRLALRQCQCSYERRSWETKGLIPSNIAALILIDEPLAAEGAVFAELLSAQTSLNIRFDVLSVTEFERAIGAVGVRGLAQLIHLKWSLGYQGLPLDQFASRVLNMTPKKSTHPRSHLKEEDRELFMGLGAGLQKAPNTHWP